MRSNVDPDRLDAAETVRAYKNLSRIECLPQVKSTVRPIYHRTSRAQHPITSDAQGSRPDPLRRPRARGRRSSTLLSGAKRSPAARRKAGRKQTDSGLTVHSFRSVIDQLGTLVANTIELVESGATFQLRTRPTPLQQRCFDLLEVKLKM